MQYCYTLACSFGKNYTYTNCHNICCLIAYAMDFSADVPLKCMHNLHSNRIGAQLSERIRSGVPVCPLRQLCVIRSAQIRPSDNWDTQAHHVHAHDLLMTEFPAPKTRHKFELIIFNHLCNMGYHNDSLLISEKSVSFVYGKMQHKPQYRPFSRQSVAP